MVGYSLSETHTEIILNALKDANTPASLLAENIPVLFAYIDKNETYQFINQYSGKWFKLSANEMIGKSMLEVLGRPVYEKLKPRVEKVLNGQRVVFEDFLPYRTGSDHLVSIVYSPDIDERGKTRGFYSLISNLAEREKSNKTLLEKYEHLELAIKGSNDGIWDIDLANKRIYYSPRFKQLLGYKENEISNEALYAEYNDRVHPDDSSKVYEVIEKNLSKDMLFDVVYRYKIKSGEYRWFRARGNAVKNEAGEVLRVAGSLSDITQNQKMAIELEHQATHDSLTGLINRREFERRLEQALHNAKTDRAHHVIAYLDLDQFKVVNDTVGHTAGDELLCNLSNLMREKFRSSDIVSRLGGDEFGLLMHNCTLEQALPTLHKLRALIEDFLFVYDEKSFKVTASIGVKELSQDCLDVSNVISSVDTAMRSAKQSGKNCIYVYQDADTSLMRKKGEVSMFYKLNQALENNNFILYYQPIVPVNSKTKDKCYEILLRMVDDDGSLIPPGAFIPVAERYGISSKLDMWVINAVFKWFDRHSEYRNDSDTCAINLSGLSLENRNVLTYILAKAHEYDVPKNKICFEITETAVISKLKKAHNFINTLRAEGFKFALDDFGSGISSYMYLKTLPVDVVKIDGSFVKDIHEDEASVAIVKSINELAHIMGKKTVAEFVENDEILNRLKVLGVDHAQGYGICKPQALEELMYDSEPGSQEEKISATG